MSAPPPTSDGEATAALTAATPRQIKSSKHVIPPLSRSTATPLSIQRRLDMRLRPTEPDHTVLSQKLNQLALERTPRKAKDYPLTQNEQVEKKAASLPAPSPGLRRIREKLQAEKENLPNRGAAAARRTVGDDGAAVAKAAEAERSAARAIESIFEHEEELLSAMSSALTSAGMPTPSRSKSQTLVKLEGEKGDNGRYDEKTLSKMRQAMLSRVVKSVEDVTREQLIALPDGPSTDDDLTDLKATAVYWITMARFEECHDRIDAARKYLQEGIEYVTSGEKEGLDGNCSTITQNALRLALDRFEERVSAHGGADGEQDATAATRKVSIPPSRSSMGRKPMDKMESGEAVTPTRRSERIRRKSLERQGK